MLDDLIDAVARETRMDRAQARAAVMAVWRCLTARLPSKLVGELHARVAEIPGRADPVATTDAHPDPTTGPDPKHPPFPRP
ncbi:MAG: hypothetical protein KGL43_19700 [Burkholderiales bacterium]|nr:hypothetical protein [Burkholderiales bacterium]MDE2455820.1 hypothetical protein [Burkholderiales bacterium]